MALGFCNNCENAADFLTATLGTSTDLKLTLGGLSFLMLARCDEDVTALGTTLANWNDALQKQAAYRVFKDCYMNGGQIETGAPATQVGSCGYFVVSKRPLDGTLTIVLRQDNNAADVYKFLYDLNGQQVKFVTGSCDDQTLYDWRTGTLVLTGTEIPDNNQDSSFNTYTIEIRYKSDGNSFDQVGQTWKISQLVIP